MDSVRRHFLANLGAGRVLSSTQLQAWAKRRNLLGKKGVTASALRDIRKYWREISKFGPGGGRPKHFQSIQIPKLGTVQLDGAFFAKDYPEHNDGYKGFLLLVATATGRLHAVPMMRKSGAEYVAVLRKVFRKMPFPAMDVLQSDREGALRGKAVQRFLRKKGVPLHLLTSSRKAFLVERAIRKVKTDISMALESRRSKRWLELLPKVVANINNAPAYGTSFKKTAVNRKNFLRFLDERFGSADHTMSYSGSALDFDAVKMAGWAGKVFGLSPGDRVLISRAAAEKRGEGYAKKSHLGSYNPEPHVVTGGYLRSDRKGDLVAGTDKSAPELLWGESWPVI